MVKKEGKEGEEMVKKEGKKGEEMVKKDGKSKTVGEAALELQAKDDGKITPNEQALDHLGEYQSGIPIWVI
jgi:hypothetical protein